MFGENPVRHNVTPISSATETKRFLKISNSMELMARTLTRPPPRHPRCAAHDGAPAGRPRVSELVDSETEAGGTTVVAWPPTMTAGPAATVPGGSSSQR